MVIDTHSHIGNDYYCGTMNIEDYISLCQKAGVDIGFLMPTPWPCLKEDEKFVVQLLWEHQDYINKSYFKLVDNKKIMINYNNPYLKINNYLKNLVDSHSTDSLKLYFVPLIHGVLDSPDYIESLVKQKDIPAVKIHGFGSGFSINDIKGEIIEILRSYQVPIILHTSVYNYNYGYGYDTKYFRNECHPFKWAKFLLDNKLKGVLNHGALLNSDAIELVNSNSNLMIGLGPDLDLANDYLKMDIGQDDLLNIGYLKLLKQSVNPDKILFDIDYKWNINPSNNKVDTFQLDRLKSIWNSEDFGKIVSKNALDFFGIDEAKQLVKKL